MLRDLQSPRALGPELAMGKASKPPSVRCGALKTRQLETAGGSVSKGRTV